MPVVTVIVPCYNYGHFIKSTLNSVAAQTYSDWECIIIDDGSTDETQAIVSAYVNRDKRFRYVYQTNKGLSAARNTGIKNAAGQYLQFLDADDLLESHKLELQVEYFKDHPETDIVYGEARYFATEHPEERRYTIWGEDKPWMPKVSGTGYEIIKALVITNIMVVSSPLIREKIFQACGLFDESLKSHEDWDLWLRCAKRGVFFQFLAKQDTFALIRCHTNSLTHKRTSMLETQLQVRKKIFQNLNNDELVKINKKIYRQTGFNLAIYQINMNRKFVGLLNLIRYCFNLEQLAKFKYGCKVLILGTKS